MLIKSLFFLKIKVCDPALKTCTTIAGNGQPGLKDGQFLEAQFSEPGGLCVADNGRTLFVSDTNNHLIRVLDLELKTVRQVCINTDSVPIQSPIPDSHSNLMKWECGFELFYYYYYYYYS